MAVNAKDAALKEMNNMIGKVANAKNAVKPATSNIIGIYAKVSASVVVNGNPNNIIGMAVNVKIVVKNMIGY